MQNMFAQARGPSGKKALHVLVGACLVPYHYCDLLVVVVVVVVVVWFHLITAISDPGDRSRAA